MRDSSFLRGWLVTLLLLVAPFAHAQVVLNEIGAANGSAVISPGDTSPDYIELFNMSDTSISLSGWTLTDDLVLRDKYSFPAVASIAANGYLIVWLDSKTNYPGFATTAFTLKSSGEEVALFQGLERRDYVKFGPQIRDLPISRLPNGTGEWNISSPSPLASNRALALDRFGTNLALRLNEWVATNSAGANFDWLELYNPSTNGIVSLGGLVMSDIVSSRGTPVTTPGIVPLSFINAGDFLRFWCDGSTNRGDHLGIKLSSTLGETLTLYHPNRTGIIHRVRFGPQKVDISMGYLPDGGTNIFYFEGTNNMSPGAANIWRTLTNVLVSEVLAHTDPPLEDAIELANPTSTPLDISHWYLSNSEEFPMKFRVPANTVILPEGYIVFYEQRQNDAHSNTPGFNRTGKGEPPDFTLNSAHGDSVVISEAQVNGAVTGRRLTRSFGASANGVSFGRHVRSDGRADFVAMSARTLGADHPVTVTQFRTGTGQPNAYPLIGPLIITEIHYHPADPISNSSTNDNTVEEFIELANMTEAQLPLYDPVYPTNSWRIAGSIAYRFRSDQMVDPNGRILLVSFDPEANPGQLTSFRARYTVPSNVPVWGPYHPALNNSRGSLQLEKPDPVQLPPHPDAGFVPYVLVERIDYEATNNWPVDASGTGFSIHRSSLTGYGNDPTNWLGALPSAGRPGNVIPPRIRLVSRAPDGVVSLELAGPLGQVSVLEATADLGGMSWIVISRWTNESGTQIFHDRTASTQARFYRAKSVP